MSRLSVRRLPLAAAIAFTTVIVPAARPAAKPGRLVIVGGALEASNAAVYRAILDARSGNGPFCIIPTASATPDSSIITETADFDKYAGAGTTKGIMLTVDKPESARDPAIVSAIRACSGFFFVGGVQSRVIRTLRPDGNTSPAYEALMTRWRDGAVVSGSSAGAAVMSDPMIASGTSAGAMTRGVRRVGVAAADSDDAGGGVLITTGLGFFPAALADQHFLSRGRFGRLLVALTELDQFDLAFGIDENTALVVDGSSLWAAGASGVIVMDERGARREGRSESGIRVHEMSAGDHFDLTSRTVSLSPSKIPLTTTSGVVESPKDPFARWEFLHLLDRFARSTQTDVALPVKGGSITLRKDAAFRAVTSAGSGVQGTPAGLAMTGVVVDLRR